EDELHIQPLAFKVAFSLIQAVTGRKAFFFGLDQRQGDRLRIDIHLDPQHIIDLAAPPAPRSSTDDFDRSRRLFAPDKVLSPSAFVNGKVNQFSASIRFVPGHYVGESLNDFRQDCRAPETLASTVQGE